MSPLAVRGSNARYSFAWPPIVQCPYGVAACGTSPTWVPLAKIVIMNTEFRTIADATAMGDGGDMSPTTVLLLVYIEDRGGAKTRLIPLREDTPVGVGRSRTNVLQLDSDRVSRNHARLIRKGETVTVEDLGSRNGVRVNGRRISGPTRLSSGDEVQIGPANIIVNLTSRPTQRAVVNSASHLDSRIEAEVDRGLRYHRSVALLMLHLSGSESAVDAVLERIVNHLRSMDTMAEYSVDEFAILVPESDAMMGAVLAKRLIAEAQQMSFAAEPITLRIGIAAFPVHATQPGELLARASAALRVARKGNSDEPRIAEGKEPRPQTDEVVIGDPQMHRVYSLVHKVADTGMTVLIVGETGAGKEVVAERLHQASSRREERFVRLNCASIPETLLESELFGHERGAFTGADRRRIGYFESAKGGTLFLDEIGEISLMVQAKLLRVLERHRITRVGSTEEIEVDVRVICATNRDLELEVQRGNFREDLYFRISAFTIMVPPLRDRQGELQLLAQHFARQAAVESGCAIPQIAEETMEVLCRYEWPGNVRELRNAMERAVVLQENGVLTPEHFPERIRRSTLMNEAPASIMAENDDVRQQVADVERATIVAAMESCNGNQTHAARKLGLSRRTLIYKLEKYGLKKRPKSRKTAQTKAAPAKTSTRARTVPQGSGIT